jgi:hypothetical protein
MFPYSTPLRCSSEGNNDPPFLANNVLYGSGRDIKVDQLRDNRSRHQYGERVVMILSWNQAAMKGIGHICTTFRLETQTYVLVMRSLGDQASRVTDLPPVPFLLTLIGLSPF